MNDLILTNTKKLLGIPSDYTEFDADILMHINSVFAGLYQMGIGPDTGFVVDDNSTWESYTTNPVAVELLKTYIFYKVRLAFDPPTNGTHIESLKKLIEENEFRLRTMVDWGGTDVI